MRILFYSGVFPQPSDPDRGTFCASWCRAMAEAGHAVRVVAPRPWYERKVNSRWADLRQTLDAVQPEFPSFIYPPRALRGTYGWWMWRSSRAAVRRAAHELKPECIISYWAHPDGAAALRFAREAGIPSIVIVGGSDVLLLPKQSAARARQIREVLLGSSAVVVVARYLKQRVVEMGVAPENVHVVYQGIDPARFSPGNRETARCNLAMSDDDAPVLVSVGRFVPVKGHEVLLDACAQLRDRGRNFRLHLVGYGPLRQTLEAKVQSLELTAHVRFAGPVDQRELADWYRAADLLVMSSHSEGLPNVLREGLACGTPFVATDVGGIREIADAPGCMLVPPRDATALADGIEAALRQLPASAETVAARHANIRTWAESAASLVRVARSLVRPSESEQMSSTADADVRELEGASVAAS
jgi:teichuronic acid biosynthesis glycosyltransferase TuaC